MKVIGAPPNSDDVGKQVMLTIDQQAGNGLVDTLRITNPPLHGVIPK